MNRFFPEIQGKLGFGFMRLPMLGEDVDLDLTNRMVDQFLAAGFNYFDTAHPYIQGKSETAIRDCLAARYPRDRFVLANKLSYFCFEKEEDIRPLFELQLKQCGVEYFDFYLMHALGRERHAGLKARNAYAVVQQLKAEEKIRHVGMSFHDSAEMLDQILTEQPEMEFVQLQFNYVDYEDPHVQARKCYEVCEKHGKPVFIMEPVKGGSLVNLPQKALALLPDGSPASYAIRYAAGFPMVEVVLSGMSDPAQVEDNTSYMQNFQPLSVEEHDRIAQVRAIYQAQHRIPCTACSYCTDGCPAGIPIPDIFAQVNGSRGDNPKEPDSAVIDKAADCLQCGACEQVCPQQLRIRQLLEEISKNFSK